MPRPDVEPSRPAPRLAFATFGGRPELTADDRLAAEALRRRGAVVQPLRWDAPIGEWASFDAVIVRSVWDYHLRPLEFLQWVEALERAGTRLLNPPDVLRWNHHKSYLRHLASQGVATVPTAWVERGADVDLVGLLADRGWAEAVVKPAISASAHQTWASSRSSAPSDQGRFHDLLSAGDVLVQPLVPEVRSKGEWSLVFFGGAFSHAMLKRPREGDFRVQEELGGTAECREPPSALVEQARQALAAAPAPCVYARVDGVERDGGLVVMELELIEPVLYLGAEGGAPDRFAGACLDGLGTPRISHAGSE
jgi:glutathione synthase/RimK-type ligase-like ATP-grasp enzyme